MAWVLPGRRTFCGMHYRLTLHGDATPTLHREPRLAEEYPVLSELLTRQSELRALRFLPQLFRWLELLMYVLTPQLAVLCSLP